MKVSRAWLQKYFEKELPSSEKLADLLTFHTFEIEEVAGDLIDVKVLPDRAAYALSHRGIAKEVAAVIDKPMKDDPLLAVVPSWPETKELSITIEDDKKCPRFMGALVRGVKVGPSPMWLKEALEAVGARSINNVVDATNYVTLDMGQPLHAFDAQKIQWSEGVLSVDVRSTKGKESITTLSGEEYALPEGTLVIAERSTGKALDIAGIKGGIASAITEETTDLFVSVANFDGPSVRKASRALSLFTDASARFQNKLSPELAAYGMRDVLALIEKVAGGTLAGVVDVRSRLPQDRLMPVSLTLKDVNNLLGTTYEASDFVGALDRLGLPFVEEGETFMVTPPFERRDISLPADVIEEVGRILGYENISSKSLPVSSERLANGRFRGIERIKDFLASRGYTEISTASFAKEGEILLANPLDMTRPFLRSRLAENMTDALARAVHAAPRVLGVAPDVRLFELGSTFTKEGERLSLALGYKAVSGKTHPVLAEIGDALVEELGAAGIVSPSIFGDVAEASLRAVDFELLGKDYEPKQITFDAYRPFSVYPFALRDIAVWTPDGTEESEIENLIFKEAGELLARIDTFDRFEKEGKTSYAFRMVFESNEKTLADTDIDPFMARITDTLNSKEGWKVR